MEKANQIKIKTPSGKMYKCRSQQRLHYKPKLLTRFEFPCKLSLVATMFLTPILEQRFQGRKPTQQKMLIFCQGCPKKKITQCVGAGLDTRQSDTYLSASAWWLWKRWTFPPAGLCTEQADSQQDRVTAGTSPHILSTLLHPLSCLPFSGECCRGTQHSFIVHHWLNVIHG